MRYIANKAMGVVTVRATFNIPIDVDAMEKMIATKATQSENWEREDNSNVMQCVYTDDSSGGEVKIDLAYDTRSCYLLKAYIQVPRSEGMSTSKVEQLFISELARHKVIMPSLPLIPNDLSQPEAPASVASKPERSRWNRAPSDTARGGDDIESAPRPFGGSLADVPLLAKNIHKPGGKPPSGSPALPAQSKSVVRVQSVQGRMFTTSGRRIQPAGTPAERGDGRSPKPTGGGPLPRSVEDSRR
eukprot:CAMPEP_0117647904 /NCGR_PEP_ID=MMETSP0804-20121206/98_1 /TAXON_ID=1074897 /ORGANISM="Tetraselmis astigmatica, Strain CCMP880" /LENGTH=243 /DNA_ID=CAMNT_0005453427 /DNA_START=1 /DNA_END=733 /DNA_ORIENTATION=+